MQSLIQKYNVPGPRYTSYPTVPFWNADTFSTHEWKTNCKNRFQFTNTKEGISLYIHLPFCESLCTFCGCHKRITKRHDVEEPYIELLLKEWALYLNLFETKPIIKEIHLGGGTPTFFTAKNLEHLIKNIFKNAIIHEACDMSFEAHPNNTTKDHLQTLYNLGFRRLSLGVQDYDQKVQKVINRNQTFHSVAKVTIWAKEIGYTSISHDIIYGLPFQSLESIKDTIEKTKSLNPDRLAFYSYAHVPWLKGTGQRGFNDEDVPKDDEKRQLYELGKKLLLENGFIEIGMDHFSTDNDTLYQSFKSNDLNRNFMGYTSSKTDVLIGLGVSAISDCWTAFAQNTKDFKEYETLISQGKIPIVKGHLLNDEDLLIRKIILELMCQFKTDLHIIPKEIMLEYRIEENLTEFINDGLITVTENSLTILEKGKPFIRNICMAFDLLLKKNKPSTQLFSMTI